MRYPFDRLEGPQRKLQWILITLAAVSFFVLSLIDLPTHNELAPIGQVSLQFAGSPERAAEIVDSWARDGVLHLAGASIGFDYVWIVAYGVTLAFLGSRLTKRADPSHEARWANLGVLAAWLGIAAAVLDAIEGVTLLQLLGDPDPSSGPAALTLALASMKFTFLAISIAVIVGGVFVVRTEPERV